MGPHATTQLLDALHFRGLLRVARREGGIRVYALRAAAETERSKPERADALLELAVALYAPLPKPTLGQLASRWRRVLHGSRSSPGARAGDRPGGWR